MASVYMCACVHVCCMRVCHVCLHVHMHPGRGRVRTCGRIVCTTTEPPHSALFTFPHTEKRFSRTSPRQLGHRPGTVPRGERVQQRAVPWAGDAHHTFQPGPEQRGLPELQGKGLLIGNRRPWWPWSRRVSPHHSGPLPGGGAGRGARVQLHAVSTWVPAGLPGLAWEPWWG